MFPQMRKENSTKTAHAIWRQNELHVLTVPGVEVGYWSKERYIYRQLNRVWISKLFY